ncbi:hypothetical protein ACQ4PT_029207 [Festuca glaucescens]
MRNVSVYRRIRLPIAYERKRLTGLQVFGGLGNSGALFNRADQTCPSTGLLRRVEQSDLVYLRSSPEMGDEAGCVQESSDMSISSDDDGIEQQKKSSVQLKEDDGAAAADVLLEDPELGMTFDTENDVRDLKIEPSSNSISENNKEQLDTHQDAPYNGENTSKAILSPIAVRCARRPPSLRKESKVDKLIRQARENKKKAKQQEKKKAAQKEKKEAEQKARSMNLRNKRSNTKRKLLENDILQLEQMEHDVGINSGSINPTITTPLPYGTSGGSFNLDISTCDLNATMPAAVPYGAIQESFEFGVNNINPMMTAALLPGGSAAVVVPPILGKYTSMLF